MSHVCEVCFQFAEDHDNDRWPIPACCDGCPCGVSEERMSYYGILGDQQRKTENIKQVASDPTLTLCDYCDGTGNEFYSMYRACPQCGGGGVIEVEFGKVTKDV